MMSRLVYTLLLWLAVPLVVSKLWLRGLREPGYARNRWERFGRYDCAVSGPVIWVHAVSVGEVRASVPLIGALRLAYPKHTFLVTCMTAAGREAIDQVFGASVLAAYLPYDYPFAVRRFLQHFRPQLGILMETEVWINLLAACRRERFPVMLANGRMSSRSARGYRRLASLTRPAFESLAVVCAQSEPEATRFAALGAHHVQVTGNLKFDVDPDPMLVEAGVALKSALQGRKVLVLASTREGEERLLLRAFERRLPEALLLVVIPRHPQRFDEVAGVIAEMGWRFARRSRNEPLAGVRVLLGDTMGEMALYYAAADVAVIGGSFLPLGGQNLIEANAIGTPVVIGPHAHNFSEIVRLATEAGAAIQVANVTAAVNTALELLENPERRVAMGRAGKLLCAGHRGATARHIAAVKALLQP